MNKRNKLIFYKKKAIKRAIISNQRNNLLKIIKLDFWDVNISFYHFFTLIKICFPYIIEIIKNKRSKYNFRWFNNLIYIDKF